MSSIYDHHIQPIKHQLEQILRDTKILCELEPFVKKWSLEETLPSLEEEANSPQSIREKNRDDAISEILQSRMEDVESGSEPKTGEKILRKIKEVLSSSSSHERSEKDGDGHEQLIPFNESAGPPLGLELLEKEHALELRRTFQTLENIQLVEAVTPGDLEEYRRGLGGQPDGPERGKTSVRECKHIFLKQWMKLNQSRESQKEAFIKRIMENEDRHRKKFYAILDSPLEPESEPPPLHLEAAVPKQFPSSSSSSPDLHLQLHPDGRSRRKRTENVKSIILPDKLVTQQQRRPSTAFTLPSSSRSTGFPPPTSSLNSFPLKKLKDDDKGRMRRPQTAHETRRTPQPVQQLTWNRAPAPPTDSANKRMSIAETRTRMRAPPVVSSSSRAITPKQAAPYFEGGEKKNKLVSIDPKATRDGGNKGKGAPHHLGAGFLRPSTAVKMNAEMERFKEKLVRPRPSTAVPAHVLANIARFSKIKSSSIVK